MASSSGKELVCGTKIRAARLSALQFEVLIQFMQQNPHFAVGRAAGGSYTKEEHDTLWRTLSTRLNETEGPMKSVTKWQKCWVDLKSNARSRAAKARAMSLDSPSSGVPVFTQWDERVLKLLNDIANEIGTIAQSPVQLLEVGICEKIMPPKLFKNRKVRQTAHKSTFSNENGFYLSKNGSETGESVNSHSFDCPEDVLQSENDIEELIANVKPEVEEDDQWIEEETEECEDDYPTDPMTDCHQTPFLSQNDEEQFSSEVPHDKAKKRKWEDPLGPSNIEDSLERLSKKLCGTLDRMASAAEEANEIQMGMVNAMNRLASSFETLLPALSKVISNSSNLSKSP